MSRFDRWRIFHWYSLQDTDKQNFAGYGFSLDDNEQQ